MSDSSTAVAVLRKRRGRARSGGAGTVKTFAAFAEQTFIGNSSAKTDSQRPLARHEVRMTLQRMILCGQRPPGTKLVQMQLAKQLGFAQGVIREALIELQACGLVEGIDNRGMYVAEVTTATIMDAYDVREMHEGLAARLCCDRITRTALRELRALVERGYESGRSGKFHDMTMCYREFHERIVRCSSNRMLARLAD